MNCLLGRGYFEEVNSEVYRNNDLSNILREGHSLSLKSAVGFMYVRSYKCKHRPSENG